METRQSAGDATRFRLRPPASGDLPRIIAMWERCSPATRTARFHAPVRDIPASYLKAVMSGHSGWGAEVRLAMAMAVIAVTEELNREVAGRVNSA